MEHDLIVMVGAVAGAAFALARLTLNQQRALAERVLGQWERSESRLSSLVETLQAMRADLGELLRQLRTQPTVYLKEDDSDTLD